MNNVQQKFATVRFVTSRGRNQSTHDPCFQISCGSLEGQSEEVLTYSEMIQSARTLQSEGWTLRFEN